MAIRAGQLTLVATLALSNIGHYLGTLATLACVGTLATLACVHDVTQDHPLLLGD